jgi:hypothetical protein
MCNDVLIMRMIKHYDVIIISGSACSTVGVHSQAWSTSGISRLGSKSGRGIIEDDQYNDVMIIADDHYVMISLS